MSHDPLASRFCPYLLGIHQTDIAEAIDQAGIETFNAWVAAPGLSRVWAIEPQPREPLNQVAFETSSQSAADRQRREETLRSLRRAVLPGFSAGELFGELRRRAMTLAFRGTDLLRERPRSGDRR